MAKAKPAAEKAAPKAADAPAAKGAPKGLSAAAKANGEKTKSARSITKAQFVTEVMAASDLGKPEVVAVLDGVSSVIVKHLGPKGTGVIAMPGLFKLKAKRVKAMKGGKEVPNRFKPGEMTITKDKPAQTKVSVRPLKGLKELLK